MIPVFPTFPVIHRSHFSIFDRLLPKEFLNQHGDPFLFELYRRLGAAEFATTAALKNAIGGAGDARYDKHNFDWCVRLPSWISVYEVFITVSLIPMHKTGRAPYCPGQSPSFYPTSIVRRQHAWTSLCPHSVVTLRCCERFAPWRHQDRTTLCIFSWLWTTQKQWWT